jgi:phage gp29-like protein
MIYKEIMRDLHLRSQIRTAFNNVIQSPWAMVDRKTKSPVIEATELLQKEWFEDLCCHALDAEYWGHSLIEFGEMVDNTDAETRNVATFVFKNVVLFPREHVDPVRGNILISPTDQDGIPFRENPFNTWLLEAGKHEDLGLLEIIAKYGIYKKYTLGNWAKSSEKWGDPLLVIRSSSDSDTENAKKEEFAANFGNNGWAIFDNDDEVELLERKNEGGYKVHMDFLNYLDRENSKGVNGQTGTSDEKAFVGSSEVHERILDKYTIARLRRLMYFHNDKTLPFLISKGYKLEGLVWMPLEFLREYNAEKSPDPVNPTQSVDSTQPNQGKGGAPGPAPAKKFSSALN